MHYNLISEVRTEFVTKLKIRHTLSLKTSAQIQEQGNGREMKSTNIVMPITMKGGVAFRVWES